VLTFPTERPSFAKLYPGRLTTVALAGGGNCAAASFGSASRAIAAPDAEDDAQNPDPAKCTRPLMRFPTS